MVMFTKYIDQLTNEVMKIMTDNCGRHYNLSCPNTSPKKVEDVRDKVRESILAELDSLLKELKE
jgi:hypothetical protein|tara:strand:- start:1332 stop:1523 length:192 start_codon:yes stop_codon:yes gene_type:complete